MLDWVTENSDFLNVAANFGMLVIWMAYLQIFLMSWRKQRKAKIIINRGIGIGVDAHCLVTNMSTEAIYMQSIIVTVRSGDQEWSAPVSIVDSEDEDSAEENPARRAGRQGPLCGGGFADVGPFEKLMFQTIGQALGDQQSLPQIESLESVEVMIIGIYGSEDTLIGARRGFDIVEDGTSRRLRPQTVGTTQLGSWRYGRKLERIMKETYVN